MSSGKSSKVVIKRKEEIICADRLKVNTDHTACEATGSAVILSVFTKDRKVNIHLTDVSLIKLQQDIAKLKLGAGDPVGHE